MDQSIYLYYQSFIKIDHDILLISQLNSNFDGLCATSYNGTFGLNLGAPIQINCKASYSATINYLNVSLGIFSYIINGGVGNQYIYAGADSWNCYTDTDVANGYATSTYEPNCVFADRNCNCVVSNIATNRNNYIFSSQYFIGVPKNNYFNNSVFSICVQ